MTHRALYLAPAAPAAGGDPIGSTLLWGFAILAAVLFVVAGSTPRRPRT